MIPHIRTAGMLMTGYGVIMSLVMGSIVALASSTKVSSIQPPSVDLKLHRCQPGVLDARSQSSAAKLPPPAGVEQNITRPRVVPSMGNRAPCHISCTSLTSLNSSARINVAA